MNKSLSNPQDRSIDLTINSSDLFDKPPNLLMFHYNLMDNNVRSLPSLRTNPNENKNSIWEDSELFCVKWTPPVDGFFQFISDYRKIINCPLGGSRVSKYRYNDQTIAKVLSVGSSDNRSALPQRVSLSNFKIGSAITSYGGIYRYAGEEPEYLLAKRNDSVSYIDLIRGNYRESQLFFMIQDLPEKERQKFITYKDQYDKLWYDLHLKPAEGDAYEFGKEAFEKLAPFLPSLFEKFPSIDPEGKYLWLFPKGRPEWRDFTDLLTIDNNSSRDPFKVPRTLIPESPFECAIREFKEETNGIDLLADVNTKLLFSQPIIERYLGSNSKNYQTNYFVFQTDFKPEVVQFPTVQTGIREVSIGEVGDIKWVPLKELDQYLQPARMELVKYIEAHLPKVETSEVAAIWKCPVEMNDYNMDNTY